MKTLQPNSLHAVLVEALYNPAFRDELLHNPEGTAVRLGCIGETAAALAELTPDSYESLIGQLLGSFLLPHKAGEQFLIIPDWLDIPQPPHRKLIRLKQDYNGGVIGSRGVSITPGSAFGSGWHPTTELCIRALELYLEPGSTFLDLGTGSGILAIAAAQLDPRAVYAVDVDLNAVHIASANASLNNLPLPIHFYCGSWQAASGSRKMDFIAANLLSPVLINVMNQGLASLLDSDGWMVLSGLRVDELEKVEQAAHENGLIPAKRALKSGWAAIAARPQR